jgi:hypothetical protein
LVPGEVVTCTAIYDVPDEAAGLQAVFTDVSSLGGEEQNLELGIGN